MLKTPENHQVAKISQMLSLKLIHLLTISLLLLLFLFETYFYKNTQVMYALFLIIAVPILLSNQLKKMEPEEYVLPNLTKKYSYSNHKLRMYIYSFLVDSFGLFLLQIGNFIYPYEIFGVQYAPLFLLILRMMIRFPLSLVIRTVLHRKLMNNLI